MVLRALGLPLGAFFIPHILTLFFGSVHLFVFRDVQVYRPLPPSASGSDVALAFLLLLLFYPFIFRRLSSVADRLVLLLLPPFSRIFFFDFSLFSANSSASNLLSLAVAQIASFVYDVASYFIIYFCVNKI